MRSALALSVCVLLAACSASPQVSASGPVSANQTRARALVTGVRTLGPQRFALQLTIERVDAEAGLSSATAAGERLEAFPNFVRAEGQPVDYEADTNARLLRAGALKAGDRITVVLETQGSTWLLHDWAPLR